MNLKTKLLSKENSWVRVHFMDSSEMTGILKGIGDDYIELESYGQDEPLVVQIVDDEYYDDHGPVNNPDSSLNNSHARAKHLIPTNIIKLITIDTDNFIDEEKKRLEYISQAHKL